jgi:type II secretory pathway pseudopilin PulG
MARALQYHGNARRGRTRRIAAFTLTEALVAITIISLAGSALLLATQTSMDSSQEALDQAIADGLANQLIDEIFGLPYMEKGETAFDWPLGIEAGEVASPQRRSLFDDSDDYHGYLMLPLRDEWGIELGLGDGNGGLRHAAFRLRDDMFDRWGVRIRVRYADESDLAQDLSGTATSGFRAVQVEVVKFRDDNTIRWLADVRRVYGYVPPIK